MNENALLVMLILAGLVLVAALVAALFPGFVDPEVEAACAHCGELTDATVTWQVTPCLSGPLCLPCLDQLAAERGAER